MSEQTEAPKITTTSSSLIEVFTLTPGSVVGGTDNTVDFSNCHAQIGKWEPPLKTVKLKWTGTGEFLKLLHRFYEKTVKR